MTQARVRGGACRARQAIIPACLPAVFLVLGAVLPAVRAGAQPLDSGTLDQMFGNSRMMIREI